MFYEKQYLLIKGQMLYLKIQTFFDTIKGENASELSVAKKKIRTLTICTCMYFMSRKQYISNALSLT